MVALTLLISFGGIAFCGALALAAEKVAKICLHPREAVAPLQDFGTP